MAAGFTCSWRPGTLRPYESIGSFGAKYCYLNKITFCRFGQTLTEFLSADATGHYDIDFGQGLSRLLGEPPALVDTLSLKKFRLGPNSQALCSYHLGSEFNFEVCKYCPVCLANGYHSNLHQLVFLDKCFIHGCTLEAFPAFHQSLSHFGRETRLIKPLYDKWFKSDSLKGEEIWPEAKCPVWKLNSKRPIQRSANRVLASFKVLEKRVAAMPHRPSSLFGDSIVAQVKMATNMVGLRISVFNSLNDLKLSFKKARHFVCNAEEAIAILELNEHDFSHLMHRRQVACAISGAWPPWRIALERLKQLLVFGHENCLKLVYEGSLLTEVWRANCYERYVLAPFDRALFHKVPCDRIVTLNCLQALLDIETENPISRTDFHDLSLEDYYPSELRSLGLMREIVGFIPRNDHSLFGDINHFHFLKSSDPSVNSFRSCHLDVPSGVLANILDEVLLAHVWLWCWALFSMERQARQLDGSSWSLPKYVLEDEINRLKPLFTLHQDISGLVLKTGTFVPYKMPPWKTCLGSKSKHSVEVVNASNLMIKQFKERHEKIIDQNKMRLKRLPSNATWGLFDLVAGEFPMSSYWPKTG